MNGSKIRIFWIDDDIEYLEGFHLFRLQDKYELTTARSYEKAKQILNQKKQFDIILLDLIIRQFEEAGHKVNVEKENWFWGMRLLEYIRQGLQLQTPLLVFTVVKNDAVTRKVAEFNAIMMTKGDISPKVFTNEILRLVGQEE